MSEGKQKQRLKYSAKKRYRIKHSFRGMTTFEYWWYVEDIKDWRKTTAGFNESSSHQDCRSVRAFRRKLKKAPNGVKFILCSKYVGYDITGIGTKL